MRVLAISVHPDDPILEIARKYRLSVIEDATESLGARYKDRTVGRFGDVACFSFNGNKLITTGGGMIGTDNETIARRARYLTTQAKDDPVECVHGEIGYNYELGITTYTEPLEETGLPLQHFDLISVPHVLHLIEDPLRFLATISRYLTPAGYLWIELPNVEDALLSVYRNTGYRDFYFEEPYLFYYSVKTLSRLVDRAGFDGTVKTVQSYTLLNHMHWLLTGAPQESAKEGMSLPMIVTEGAVAPSVANELNDWLQKIDSQYREYLNRHNLGDTLSFIGRKACG